MDREINNNESSQIEAINNGEMKYPKADELYPKEWDGLTDNPKETIYPNEHYETKPRPEVKVGKFVF